MWAVSLLVGALLVQGQQRPAPASGGSGGPAAAAISNERAREDDEAQLLLLPTTAADPEEEEQKCDSRPDLAPNCIAQPVENPHRKVTHWFTADTTRQEAAETRCGHETTNHGTTSGEEGKCKGVAAVHSEGFTGCAWHPPKRGWENSKKNSDSQCCESQYATPSCTLLSTAWGKVLQGLLALAGFSSLLLKKWIEEYRSGVKRSYPVWGLDVAKQAMSGFCAHFAGIVNATLLHDIGDHRTDECSWYFISFTLDTVRTTIL